MSEAIWVCHELFNRGLVTGSTGNLSFTHDNKIYITKSGGCFGRVDESSFAILDFNGKIIEGKPSKEFPIHLALYNNNRNINAVLHTHSFYSTLVASLNELEIRELISITPYLNMLTSGNIGVVEYAKPGSDLLFEEFNKTLNSSTTVYFMKNHGVTVGANDLYGAFNILEEVEVSSKIHIKTNSYNKEDYNRIKY